MSDVTNDWATGKRPAELNADPTQPAPAGDRLLPDTGEGTAPAAIAPSSEPKSFRPSDRSPEAASAIDEAEPLLRATLETIRVKAEELRSQAREWTRVRQDQAVDFIDEKPITAVAAAFGAGLVIGALLSR